MSQLFASDEQNTGVLASASVLPMSIQGRYPLRLTGLISSPRDFQKSSPAPYFKAINSLVLWLLCGPNLTTVHRHWEDHGLDYMNLCQHCNICVFQHTVQVCHLFPAEKQLSSNIMAVVTICSDFRAQEEEICHYFHFPLFYLHEIMGPDAVILVFSLFVCF